MKNVVSVLNEFQPRASVGNNGGIENRSAVLIGVFSNVNARGTNELRYDYSFRAVDDEAARVRHKREFAHKDFLLGDFAGVLSRKLNVDLKGRGVGRVAKTTFVFVVFGLHIQRMLEEFQLEVIGKVGNRRKVVKNLSDSFVDESVVRPLLNLDKIRYRQDFLVPYLGKGLSFRPSVLDNSNVSTHIGTPISIDVLTVFYRAFSKKTPFRLFRQKAILLIKRVYTN